MGLAICIKCGHEKRKPWHLCPSCKHDPRSNPDDLVRSVYLSTARFDDEADANRYENELRVVSEKIRRGEAIPCDSHELKRLKEQKEAVESVSLKMVGKILFRVFLPALLFLLFLVAVFVFLKWIKK